MSNDALKDLDFFTCFFILPRSLHCPLGIGFTMEINSPNPHLLVNQTYVPTAIEWQYVNNPTLMLGPWMLGALLDFMFTVWVRLD